MATPKKHIGSHQQILARRVDPAELKLNPENERDYDPADPVMISQRKSIESEGVVTAIEIYEDGTVHDGNRRLFNVNHLIQEGRWTHGTVPALIVPRPANVSEGVFARLNKNESAQFDAFAQGRAFAKLRGEGHSNTDIAKRSPFTAMHVGNMLTLYDAGPSVHDAVRSRKISATLAVEVLRKHGEAILQQAIELAQKQGRERATQRHVDEVLESVVDAEAEPIDAEPVEAEPVEADVETADAEYANADPVEDEPPETESPEAEPVEAVSADAQDETPPWDELDPTPPAPPVVVKAEEVKPTAPAQPTGSQASPQPPAQPTTQPTKISTTSAIAKVAPSVVALVDAMENGTRAEQVEALFDAKADLVAFIENARQLGLIS